MGAANKEDSGLYFSWGNTEGHAEGSGYDFSQAVYDTTPGAAITANLSLSQDAARANLGALWRMPTRADFIELINNCTHVWITRNGVQGQLLTSKLNGNSIFFPAAGSYEGMSLNNRGSRGLYWSSAFVSVSDARYLFFGSSTISPEYSGNRHYGFPVRAVMKL